MMTDATGQRTRQRTTWEQAIEEVGAKAEAEVRRVMAYLNEEVVPEVRREGSRALRMAAEELRRLAERMEDRRERGAGGDGGR